jgi:ElaB/YqjD/DUF883 family membrane-anchored ribosome-binding protein
MKIFISYPRKDNNNAKSLQDILFKGGHTVWMDHQLVTGQQWHAQLEARIKDHDAIALALTSNWVASPYCNWEFITAVEHGKKVIPVLLEKTDLPERLRRYQYADLSGGFDDAKVQKLLNDLLTLAQTVEPAAIADMDKAAYAQQIDQRITVSGSQNTVTRTGNISIGGNVSGGNVNIGGSQTFLGDVNIQHGALDSAPGGTPLDELKTLLQELETALKQQPADKAEDVELVQEYANEIVEEASKESPRKKKLEITGDNLKKAAENLLGVAPIVAKIVQKLLMIG